jgi:microcompartment protein CcmK/EutM
MTSVVQGVPANIDNKNIIIINNNNNNNNNKNKNGSNSAIVSSSSNGVGATKGEMMIVSPGRSARYEGILCVVQVV